MHLSPKALQNRFTFGHILTREVTWSIKNHTLNMVIDHGPGVRIGGQWRAMAGRGLPEISNWTSNSSSDLLFAFGWSLRLLSRRSEEREWWGTERTKNERTNKQTNKRTNERTNEQTNKRNSPCFTGLCPLRGRCPKNKHSRKSQDLVNFHAQIQS